jgi:DNA-directed RNA polymerase specialized sigma24 family protein
VLRAASIDPNSPLLREILDCFRTRWLRWARAWYPRLEAQHDDVVQDAQLQVIRHIAELRDAERVEGWANAVFRSVLCAESEKTTRTSRRLREVRPGEDPDSILGRIPDVRPTTEELASLQERVKIVQQVVSVCQPAVLKFMRDLSEADVMEQTGLSRDAVATVLKRFRRVLRRMLNETDESGRPLSTARILERTGLSRELVAELVRVIDHVLGRTGDGPMSDDEGPQ